MLDFKGNSDKKTFVLRTHIHSPFLSCFKDLNSCVLLFSAIKNRMLAVGYLEYTIDCTQTPHVGKIVNISFIYNSFLLFFIILKLIFDLLISILGIHKAQRRCLVAEVF